MKAIVLAAGKGTRLGTLTREVPKVLLPVNGKPILEHILSWLQGNGIREVGINLHTFSEMVVSCFGDGTRLGVKIHYVYEQELSGTAGALPKFREWLGDDDRFLVVYGDILTDQPVEPLVRMHDANNAFATLLLHRRNVSNSCIDVDASGRIVRFNERPDPAETQRLLREHPDGFLVNSAVQILARRLLEYIQANNSFDLPKDVYMPNVDQEKIYGLELTGRRVAVDSPARLDLASKIFC